MKSLSLAVLALAATAATASPLAGKRDAAPAVTDTQILQFALVLENLENAFYSGALAKFDADAFVQAGLPAFARGRFEQVAQHEAEHVKFLSTALGNNSVAPCTYNFPYTDPKSFAALSMVLEGVGTSAYLGAASLITNPAYLTAAAAILTTEARHAAWVASAVLKENPWSGPFDTPLDLNQIFSLAAPFITSCPSTNPTLPVKAFPALTVSSPAVPGASVTLNFTDSGASGDRFFALFSGLTPVFVKIGSGDKVTLPDGLQGTVYGIVTSNGTVASDSTTVAGPAILEFPFNSATSNP